MDLVECPICCRKYIKDAIESHANKCLFLNSERNNNSTTKRCLPNPEDKDVTTSQKKIKLSTNLIDTSVISPDPGYSLSHRQDPKTNEHKKKMSQSSIPLAEQMRPSSILDILGQDNAFGPTSMIRSLLEQNEVPNMILWGPPGCGKTSVANVIGNICKASSSMRFVKLVATTAGINDVKEIVKIAKNELQFAKKTILFMDEIHRFNKLQQDTFLPHVENGTITLVGATTENPSFSLNNALLSRCRVIVLEKLSTDDILKILEKAVKNKTTALMIDSKGDNLLKEAEAPMLVTV